MAEKKQQYRFTGATYAAMHAGLAGWIARRRGASIADCPYNAQGDARERALAHYWVKGWSRATPEA